MIKHERIIKSFSIILISLLVTIIYPNVDALAETKDANTPIELDGNFEDWNGKPVVRDKVGDAPALKDDLIELRYYNDEEYLYLYVEREAPQGKEEWDIQAVFHNGTGYEQIHLFPWENKGKPDWEWATANKTTVKINVNYEWYPKDGFRVQVKLGDELIETTYSASVDGKRIEFRIPLKPLGLDGKGQEIQFSVKSPPEAYYPTVDWIGDNGPIIITQGPVFGSLTWAIVMLALGGVAYIVYRK
ncbi:MAG: hypothetical protein ACRC2K_05845 [Clostridium sp.]